jgi:putative integral membrane protein (TIGR02587 family)
MDVAKGLGRAFGGALLFGLPMLMTMELWRHGAGMDRWRLLQLFALAAPLLVGVAHRLGFKATFGWRDDLRDAVTALGIGCLTSALILAAFNVISPGMSLDEIFGKIAVQSVPAALGALLGQSQLGGGGSDEADEGEQALSGYFGTLFLMLVGALFFSLNMAPTDEMMIISYMMTPWHAILLVCASLLVMHAFVFAVGFRGGATASADLPWWSSFLRFTVAGYAVSLLISHYVLWTYERTADLGVIPALMATIVLAFPAAIGAAAARLIL